VTLTSLKPIFFPNVISLLGQHEKSLMKTMVEDANQRQRAADLRAEYAEVNKWSGF
jgi:hypothetical protein